MADRDRALSPRGVKAAARMAQEIVSHDLLPDRIICSPARRTRETLAALTPFLPGACLIEFVEALYDSANDYRQTIRDFHDRSARLLVVGHNPATHITALNLIGAADTAEASAMRTKYPTGALTVLDFGEGDWARLRPGSGRLVAFIRPRDLDHGADED